MLAADLAGSAAFSCARRAGAWHGAAMAQEATRRNPKLWLVALAVGAVALLVLAPEAITAPLARFLADIWVSIMSFLVALLRPVFGG